MAQPPPQVLELVQRFDRNRDAYRSPHYHEAQLRREFLDPLFKALGWDIDNEQGYAEAYKDVVHEDAIKVGEATKAPDYCFRVGGARKFFLEAKRPSVDIKNDASPAFQLRRYAWTTKLPLSVLSDFEEFAVYDCRIKPHHRHSAAIGRILYIPYSEYASRWDEIAGVFSRDAVLKGSFDKFAQSTKAKRGTADVDDEFLKTIENWRADLSHNLALRNPRLSQRELNFAVQRTIDRIIFLRICEGRGIENYGRLRALINGDRIYPRLCQIFEEADTRYNSGLFHFKPEKDRHEAPDELTLALDIDDKLLRDIIKGLYYPESPYVFSALPADILGQVYEQFLGKVIRLTEGHRAVVEEKPEVKKAGGVYYTPTYVVDYIVQTTVGALLEGKTPKQAAKLKILDPACGSGSFLIGAYEHLLKWHRDFYTRHDPARWAKGPRPVLVQVGAGNWKLTIAERKRILLDNIFGVDIDSQAVETTKLSLLLKVLEGETQQSLQPVLRLFHERALPDLGDNIKCGNSLIGPDFYQQRQMPLLDEEERYRINVFDWQAEFPQIFRRRIPSGELRETPASPSDYTVPGVPLHGSYTTKKTKSVKAPLPWPRGESEWDGGFDAVIGNPPYIRIQGMKEWAPLEVEFYRQQYQSASRGNYDTYVVFVERGLSLLNPEGRVGFILPHKFFNAEYGAPLRELLSRGGHLSQIVHFGAQQVFPAATTYTCLLFLRKSRSSGFRFVSVPDLATWIKTGAGNRGEIAAEKISGEAWNFAVGEGAELIERMKSIPVKLGDVADIFVGLQTSADDVLIMDLVSEGTRTLLLHSKALDADLAVEKELFHPLVSGTDVHGYAPLPARQFILFPYEVSEESVRLIPLEEILTRFPKTADYLLCNRKTLENREKGRMKGGGWHGYIYLKNMRRQGIPKVCVPRLVDRLCAGFDPDGSHFLDNVDVGGVTLKPSHARHDLRYLLGLLNSRLLAWFFPNVSAPFRGNWMSANRQFLSQLPIRGIDASNPADKTRHDQIVQLVEQMLVLHQRLSVAKTPQETTALERQITATDSQLDRIVYDLYALTEDEIKIVEGATP